MQNTGYTIVKPSHMRQRFTEFMMMKENKTLIANSLIQSQVEDSFFAKQIATNRAPGDTSQHKEQQSFASKFMKESVKMKSLTNEKLLKQMSEEEDSNNLENQVLSLKDPEDEKLCEEQISEMFKKAYDNKSRSKNSKSGGKSKSSVLNHSQQFDRSKLKNLSKDSFNLTPESFHEIK